MGINFNSPIERIFLKVTGNIYNDDIELAREAMRLGQPCNLLLIQYRHETPYLPEMIRWGELNLQGMFFIGAYLHYFEFEEDMVKFILQWG